MRETLKIKLFIGTGFVGADHKGEEEVDKQFWQGLTEKQQDEYLEEAARDFLNNHIEYTAYIEEEN